MVPASALVHLPSFLLAPFGSASHHRIVRVSGRQLPNLVLSPVDQILDRTARDAKQHLLGHPVARMPRLEVRELRAYPMRPVRIRDLR